MPWSDVAASIRFPTDGFANVVHGGGTTIAVNDPNEPLDQVRILAALEQIYNASASAKSLLDRVAGLLLNIEIRENLGGGSWNLGVGFQLSHRILIDPNNLDASFLTLNGTVSTFAEDDRSIGLGLIVLHELTHSLGYIDTGDRSARDNFRDPSFDHLGQVERLLVSVRSELGFEGRGDYDSYKPGDPWIAHLESYGEFSVGNFDQSVIFALDSPDKSKFEIFRSTLLSIDGRASNDLVITNDLRADIATGGGNDRIIGNTYDDKLDAGTGSDTIYGSGGIDDIYGGSGSDVLYGGSGSDKLAGGTGADVFILTDREFPLLVGPVPQDRFVDYNRGSGSYSATEGDLIDLSGVSFANGAGSSSTVRLRSVVASGDLPAGAVLEILVGDIAAGNWQAIARLDGVAAGEAVRIALTEAQAAARTGSSFVVDAVGNGTTWSISPGARNVAEGNITISFTITRSGTNLGDETVYVSTTQTQGFYNDGDYVGRLNVPVFFVAGDKSETFTVRINADAMPEGDETFGLIVQADPDDPLSVRHAIATFTIQDGAPPTVSGSSYVGNEFDNVWSGSSSRDIAFGMAGNDRLSGSGGNDILVGGEGTDDLDGGIGNDTLIGGRGTMSGGSGNDVIDIREATYVQVNSFAAHLQTLTSDVDAGDGDDQVFAGFWSPPPGNADVNGGVGYDVLTIDLGRSDNFAARIQWDFDIDGAFDQDFSLFEIAAADGYLRAYTAYQNDNYTTAWLGISGFEAVNYRGGAFNDTFFGNNDFRILSALGGAGIDSLYADWSSTTAAIVWNQTVNNDVQRTLGNGVVVQSIERLMLWTGSGNDNLTLGSLDDFLSTGAGNDRLNGGGGNDVLTGGTGADTLTGGSGADSLDGGLGSDVLNYGNSTGGVSVDLRLNTASGGDASGDTIKRFEIVFGGFGHDTLTGTAGANLLSGNGGNDSIAGNGGNDTLIGGSGSDTLTGGSGVDSLSGGGSADTIDGGTGADTLVGGLGKDSLTGGTGADIFVFDTAVSATNVDRISDYSALDDTIWLDDAFFSGLAIGTLAASAFAANLTGQAAYASDRILYETDTGRLFFDMDGVGGSARVQFATISAGLVLSSADFIGF